MEGRTRSSKARPSRNSVAYPTSPSSKEEKEASEIALEKKSLEHRASVKGSKRKDRQESTASRNPPTATTFPSTPASTSSYGSLTTSSQLSNTHQHRGSRRSNASDNSSSYSTRGASPFSAPATPATSYSVATTASSSSLPTTQKSARWKDSSYGGPSGRSASRSRSTRQPEVKRQSGGPHVDQASKASDSHSLYPSKGKKRARSSSPTSSGPQADLLKKSRKSDSTTSSSYSLRPRPSNPMTPHTKQPGTEDGPMQQSNSAPSKTKTSRGRAAKVSDRSSGVLSAAAPSSSTSATDSPAMEVDTALFSSEYRGNRGDAIVQDTLSTNGADEQDNDEREDDADMDDDEEQNEDESYSQRAHPFEEGEEDEDGRGEEDEDADEDEDDEDDEDDEGQYDDEMGDQYGDNGESSGGFGNHLRAMAGYMSGLASRFRTLLSSIRDRSDPASQLVALQDLSEVLSISNEDTLAGYFPTEPFVSELIYLMGGPKPQTHHPSLVPAEGTRDKTGLQENEDEEMAAVIAAATGLDDSGERMLLACRCLANLIEAMPYAAHTVVSLGAVPVLNSKLMQIEFIDLAEQVLQTLEKISGEYPSSIVRENGLQAMLQYLDFFNIHVQRTAMNAAANCCRRLSTDSFPKAKDVMPIIKNVLLYSDQRMVESACRCIVRLVDSFRHQSDLLEQLLTDEVVASINAILLPSSNSAGSTPSSGGARTTVNTATYTDVLKALGVAARVSPKMAVTLLENNIVETLYHLLTGSPAPDEDGHGGRGPAAAISIPKYEVGENVAAVAVVSSNSSGVRDTTSASAADVAVLQNLAHRPKEQVQEALSLVAELLPPLPRSGVFDPRMYTEKACLRRKSKLARANRSAKEPERSRSVLMEKTASEEANIDDAAVENASQKAEKTRSDREVAKEQAQSKRVETLRARQALVKRFTQLTLPTLVEVYAASVTLHVRIKALFGIIKIVSFVEPEPLMQVLDNVPLASLIAAILSSRDHPTLVQGTLQLVELLTLKLPGVYSALLRREGVLWEIEDIAAKEPKAKAIKAKSAATSNDALEEASLPIAPHGEPAAEATSAPTSALPSSVAPSSDLSRLLAGAGAQGLTRLSGYTPSSGRVTGGIISGNTAVSLMPLSANGQPVSMADAEDSNIWRARILRDQFVMDVSKATSGGADEAGRALGAIRDLVSTLQTTATEDAKMAEEALARTAKLFAKAENPISSFELLRSGMVDALYSFAVGDSAQVPRGRRRALLAKALMELQGEDSSAMTAAVALIRRLQETLSRLENFDITTAINNSTDEMRRSPTANVARQIRLKLVADSEGGEIPRNCTNLVVSIHAITSFQSLNDYLRPKIAASQAMSSMVGATSSSDGALASSHLSGALAAFASSTGLDMYPSLRNSLAAASASRSQGGLAGAISQSVGGRSGSSSSSAKKGHNIAESDNQEEVVQKGVQSGGDRSAETGKRRSSRLSSKGDQAKKDGDEEEVVSGGSPKMDETLARRLVEGLLQDEMEGVDDEDGFVDEDEYDEDVIEGDAMPGMETPGAAGDRTIHLDVVQDGSKVEAKTPEGTRVSTPPSELSRSAPSTSSAPIPTGSSKTSYASALQKKPTDWHLEFKMEGHEIPLESTIYGVIHRYEMQRQPSGGEGSVASTRYIWSNTYTVNFRKVPGPVPAAKDDSSVAASTESPTSTSSSSVVRLPSSIAADAPYARILQLLRVLYNLNGEWRADAWHVARAMVAGKTLAETSFVNNKLTAKLNRQLEEPMIVASNCMPDWSLDLPRCFPFLFPFEVRYAFLQSTSFGYHRLINRWQNQQSRNQDSSTTSSSNNSRHDDSLALLGRLTRQKVRISRNNILASAFKVFELYGTNTSLLEVEYFEEVGTGLGPTLEFYALVSKEFARRDLQLWRSSDDSDHGEYVFSPTGLFPAPSTKEALDSAKGKSKLQAFKVLGQFVAKALFDSRIVDLHFSTTWMRVVTQQTIPETLGVLNEVDVALSKSLEKLQTMDAVELESLGLDFTLPGLPEYELHPGGQEETVNKDNVDRYVQEVIHHTLVQGVDACVEAFRQGFNLIFPIAAMSIFTPEELVILFGNSDEDWSETTLMSSIKPDHGYNAESATFRNVISIMSHFSLAEKRDFLQWLTGSPKLPIGGFAGLHPPLTIVKRPPEANVDPDRTLPSVMTCVNFCKLPPFSTKAIMKERLLLAMREGQASFHLS